LIPDNALRARLPLREEDVREMLLAGGAPPEEFTRPEVAKVLIKSMIEQS